MSNNYALRTPVGFPLAVAAVLFVAAPARAQIDLGAARDYVLLGLEDGTVIVNSASRVVGDFGYSARVTSLTNQKIGADDEWTGTAYVHSQVAEFRHAKNYQPSGGIVTNAAEDARLDAANVDALALSAHVAMLAPTQTFGIIDDTSIVIGSVDGLPNLHVIEVAALSMNSDTIRLIGDPDDVFVFNIRGDFRFSQSEVLLEGGATANNVLFNFPANGTYTRDVLVNKSATSFNGTILAPDLDGFAVEYHNPASFHGAIIAKNIIVHSDFSIEHEPFTGGVCPRNTPASATNYGTGLAGCDGIPTMTSDAPPVIGQSIRLRVGNAGEVARTCGLFWGGSQADMFVPLLGGNLLVGSIILVQTITVPGGGFAFDCFVSPDCGAIGIQVFMQSVCIDPCGPTGFSMTPGLRLIIGV